MNKKNQEMYNIKTLSLSNSRIVGDVFLKSLSISADNLCLFIYIASKVKHCLIIYMEKIVKHTL